MLSKQNYLPRASWDRKRDCNVIDFAKFLSIIVDSGSAVVSLAYINVRRDNLQGRVVRKPMYAYLRLKFNRGFHFAL